jgi:hypothetical protein
MARGGKREGAGRPKGSKDPNTLKAELFRSALISKAIEEQKEIFDALFGQAKLGNVPAIKKLLERVLGKVPASIDAGEDGQALFQIIIKQMNEQSPGGVIQ